MPISIILKPSDPSPGANAVHSSMLTRLQQRMRAVAVINAKHAGGPGEYGEPLNIITIHAGDYSFRAHTGGDPQDPPVILLHGFPETSFMWRSLQAVLAERGYYSIAFDQRGYSPDARPRGRGRYA